MHNFEIRLQNRSGVVVSMQRYLGLDDLGVWALI